MRTITAFACTLLAATAARAQQTDTIRLEPVVVTATRSALPLSKISASVTVIDGDQLRKSGVRTVAEALRTVSGAAVVQSGSYGASTSLFLRGGESDYVQVLVDGVQVNSPGEQFNWSNLAIEDIDRIEVVKGPASVLYGSDAVTGVVQLFTKQRTGAARGELSFAAGRGDKVGAQAHGAFDNGTFGGELSGGSDRAAYSLGVSHFGTEGGYAFNNEHRNTSFTGHAAVTASAATRVNASVRYGKSRFHYPTDGTGQLVDQNQFQDATMVAAGLEASHQLSPSLAAQLSLTHDQNDGMTDDAPDNVADTIGFSSYHSDERFRRQDADLRVSYQLRGNSTFTAGTEFERQYNRGSSTSSFGDSPEKTETRTNKAAYAQLLADVARASIQLGVRGEDNQKFGRVGTYRGGISLPVTNVFRLRASAGTAFKEPRFYEQFAEGYVKGNPALKPEHSRSIEAGAEARLVNGTGNLRFAASYFNQEFRDLIQYVGFPANPNDPNYLNVAGARSNGLELEGEASWSRFGWRAGYMLLDTRVTEAGDGQDPSFLNGERLLRRPRHSGSLTLTASPGRTSAAVTANFVGRRDDLDFATYPAARIELPSYTRVDLSTRLHLTRTTSISLKIENALDARYEEVHAFPALGRVLFVGGGLTF